MVTLRIFMLIRRENSPKQAIFREIHQREIFQKGGIIRGAHKRAHRFATARPLIGRTRGGTNPIRGTHSHCRTIASIYAPIWAVVLYLMQDRCDSPRNQANRIFPKIAPLTFRTRQPHPTSIFPDNTQTLY